MGISANYFSWQFPLEHGYVKKPRKKEMSLEIKEENKENPKTPKPQNPIYLSRFDSDLN